MPGAAAPIYRFGVFRFEAESLDLQRDGQPVRLQPQPARVLAMLLDRAGRLVTRDELRQAIWGDDTFVDFDRGLNFCIAQIRTSLGDAAATPRYVRTVPKKGYEFICPVERLTAAVGVEDTNVLDRAPTEGWRTWMTAAALAAVTVAALAAYVLMPQRPDRPVVAVARFDNETGDLALTRFSDDLTDTLVERLTVASRGHYDVVGNAAILRRPRDQRDLRAIGASLHADYVVLGQVQRDADHVRVLGHLIHLPEQRHITVARFDNVADRTLSKTNEIASEIAARFAPPLVARLASPVAGTR